MLLRRLREKSLLEDDHHENQPESKERGTEGEHDQQVEVMPIEMHSNVEISNKNAMETDEKVNSSHVVEKIERKELLEDEHHENEPEYRERNREEGHDQHVEKMSVKEHNDLEIPDKNIMETSEKVEENSSHIIEKIERKELLEGDYHENEAVHRERNTEEEHDQHTEKMSVNDHNDLGIPYKNRTQTGEKVEEDLLEDPSHVEGDHHKNELEGKEKDTEGEHDQQVEKLPIKDHSDLEIPNSEKVEENPSHVVEKIERKELLEDEHHENEPEHKERNKEEGHDQHVGKISAKEHNDLEIPVKNTTETSEKVGENPSYTIEKIEREELLKGEHHENEPGHRERNTEEEHNQQIEKMPVEESSDLEIHHKNIMETVEKLEEGLLGSHTPPEEIDRGTELHAEEIHRDHQKERSKAKFHHVEDIEKSRDILYEEVQGHISSKEVQPSSGKEENVQEEDLLRTQAQTFRDKVEGSNNLDVAATRQSPELHDVSARSPIYLSIEIQDDGTGAPFQAQSKEVESTPNFAGIAQRNLEDKFKQQIEQDKHHEAEASQTLLEDAKQSDLGSFNVQGIETAVKEPELGKESAHHAVPEETTINNSLNPVSKDDNTSIQEAQVEELKGSSMSSEFLKTHIVSPATQREAVLAPDSHKFVISAVQNESMERENNPNQGEHTHTIISQSNAQEEQAAGNKNLEKLETHESVEAASENPLMTFGDHEQVPEDNVGFDLLDIRDEGVEPPRGHASLEKVTNVQELNVKDNELIEERMSSSRIDGRHHEEKELLQSNSHLIVAEDNKNEEKEVVELEYNNSRSRLDELDQKEREPLKSSHSLLGASENISQKEAMVEEKESNSKVDGGHRGEKRTIRAQ